MFSNTQVQDGRHLQRIFRDVADPFPSEISDRGSGDVLPEETLAAFGTTQLPQDQISQLALPVAGDPGHADDLACVDLQIDLRQPDRGAFGPCRDLSQFEDRRRAGRCFGPRFDGGTRQVFLEHHPDELVLRRLGPRQAAGHTPASQNRDPVGALQDFVQLVGDEDDGQTIRHQVAQDFKQPVDFLRRQDTRRLVEDEDAGFGQQEFEQFDFLLLPDRKVLDVRPGIDLKAIALPQGFELAGDRREVRNSRQAGQEEGDVLDDGERRDEGQALEDHPDVVPARFLGRPQPDGLAVHQDLPGVALVIPVDAFDQRALAGAVFPQERVDLAREGIEGNRVVGQDAGEALGQFTDAEERVSLRRWIPAGRMTHFDTEHRPPLSKIHTAFVRILAIPHGRPEYQNSPTWTCVIVRNQQRRDRRRASGAGRSRRWT
jgi:hypothetical protein